jgi:MFS family permease
MTARTSPGATVSPSPHADGSARKWWALVAIAASVLVVGLDLTVLTLALPTIAADLHASTGDLQWFTDAYSLVLAAAILPAGLLGDRFGRKKVLLIALTLFGFSSAACAYATSTGELIAARAVLGIGAAAIFPLSLSVIPVLFGPQERQRAITLMTSATFLSFPIGPIGPIGPIVGGYLLDHFWWGSVFLINVPVVAIALTAVVFLLPESRLAPGAGPRELAAGRLTYLLTAAAGCARLEPSPPAALLVRQFARNVDPVGHLVRQNACGVGLPVAQVIGIVRPERVPAVKSRRVLVDCTA